MTANSEKLDESNLVKAEDLYKKFDRLSAFGRLTSGYINPKYSPELLEAMDDTWFLLQSLCNDEKSLVLIDKLNMALAEHILCGEK